MSNKALVCVGYIMVLCSVYEPLTAEELQVESGVAFV
jgi:hypothetical protein